ncbi:hypothetical protein BJ878DRAFT_333797 [Calycina marina]|uniref:Grh/CP2 DB domain-containing protein n=1 Tax=Calycina marina TaxID=1763456 RepID=A0A9P7Z5N7_9HELO|nr:hypothetical protein BJ878DRAFT_333797 [Calycina marina]
MDTPSTSKSEVTEREETISNPGDDTQGEKKRTTERLSRVKSEKDKAEKSKSRDDSKKVKSKKNKKRSKVVNDSEASSSSSSSKSESDSSDDSSSTSHSESESEKKKKKKKRKAKKAKLKAKEAKKAKEKRKAKKKKKKKKSNKEISSDSDSDSNSNSDTDSDNVSSDEEEEDEVADTERTQQLQQLVLQQQQQMQHLQTLQAGGWNGLPTPGGTRAPRRELAVATANQLRTIPADLVEGKTKETKKKGNKLVFRRVDQLWDNKTHRFELKDTAEEVKATNDEGFLFNVRRTFTWEGEYKRTLIDIKSPDLKEALRDVMDGIKGLSLVEESPTVDPKMLFIHLEDLRAHSKEMKNSKVDFTKKDKKEKKEKLSKKASKKTVKKLLKHNELKRQHLKVLLKYLDKDYADTKKALYPMLEAGIITFDLLWALYKPNDLVYTTTYGTLTEPRIYRIEQTEKYQNMNQGEFYYVEGKYLEYDGKTWGMGTMSTNVSGFKGAKRIDSLPCFPLKYHKEEATVRAELIERGKKFVSLQGVNYRAHLGMAYYKKKKQIIKVNINGRIMVDPAIHRRLNPNYLISTVKPKDEDEENCCCGHSDLDSQCSENSESDDEAKDDHVEGKEESEDEDPQVVTKLIRSENGKTKVVRIDLDPRGEEVAVENLEVIQSEKSKENSHTLALEEKKPAIPVFTDDEYLIASSVVLGFSFAEKLWLEFTVSGVNDIVYNEGAYESLVLPEDTKAIVKALVESHKYHPAQSIDDVIQGKGKGLVAVLHGPPGTGKTLTAEGISEFLKCPLYMVSAGELGTNPTVLEHELQKILDVAHAWGAVLLLDEADVFLEARTTHDIHRNALVSIFLCLLEYFQGILFLTTNRVETFDDAFQSRIHVAIRYGELSIEARKSVFKMFIEKVKQLNGAKIVPFKESDYDTLAKHNLNGRQIKNTVRTAQALAVNVNEPLSMVHIKRVLDVSKAFDQHLKGGPGFEESMRHYF